MGLSLALARPDLKTDASSWFRDLGSDAVLADLRDWFATEPSRPKVLEEVVDATLAPVLGRELLASAAWQHQRWIWKEDWVEQVDLDVFESTPTDRRLSSNDTLALEHVRASTDLRVARAFVGAVVDGSMASWLSRVTGYELAATPSCEFARYRRGEYLAAHSDTFSNRRIGMILYLNPAPWEPEFGGQLGYRNERGDVSYVEPRFNTAAFIPFRTDCQHWVVPLERDEPRRLSASVHYMDAS